MVAIISMPARRQPLDRGEPFEDPFDAWLQARDFGGVADGGTAFIPDAEIDSVDIELALNENGAAAIDAVIAHLDTLWPPKGSVLRIDDAARPFGTGEGAALYLNGVDWPDAVYATHAINDPIPALDAAIAGHGRLMRFWQGETETALDFSGASFAMIRDALAPLIAASPLCERSRLVQIA